jgi:hypothetical protein
MIYTVPLEKGWMDRWLALSTDATWLRLPLLMLLASAAAPAASLPPSSLSLSRVGNQGKAE